MSKYTYQVFAGDDHSNARVEAARKSFKQENTGCYVISINGQMHAIQFDGLLPYPGATMEESAENHITALTAQDEQAAKEAQAAQV